MFFCKGISLNHLPLEFDQSTQIVQDIIARVFIESWGCSSRRSVTFFLSPPTGSPPFTAFPSLRVRSTITDQTITMVDNDAIVRHTLTGETET